MLIQALRSKELVIQQAVIAALGEIQNIDTVDRIIRFVQSDD